MSEYRVSLGVWRMGGQPMFSYFEVDKHYNTTYSMVYPITHQEAVGLSAWATNRARHYDAEPLFDPFGWSIYIDSLKVMQPDSDFHPFYSAQRLDPKCFIEYRELAEKHHSSRIHSVE